MSEVLKKVPEVKEMVSEKVGEIPAKDDLKTRVSEILDQFPADDERVAMIRNRENVEMESLWINSF